MTDHSSHPLSAHISPLTSDGLHGRVLRAPAAEPEVKREILLIYGHHAMIERWFGLIENLQPYGSVVLPDLPGFGGMDSFYHAGKRPTIDNFADYLADFVRSEYAGRPVTVIAISFGFLVVTRMLQKYPELSAQVTMLVSMVGFMHHEDFLFKPLTRRIYSVATGFFSTPPIATIIRYGFMNRLVIQTIYARLPAGKKRFIEVDVHVVDQLMEFETQLWQANDVRTHWATTSEFLQLDNCQPRINLPIWHVASKHDHYFDNTAVQKHMLEVFTDYHLLPMNSLAHTPNVVATVEEVAVMLPPELRALLSEPLE
jgi:pimeloyl-ACP methyl ester carboxylesterase